MPFWYISLSHCLIIMGAKKAPACFSNQGLRPPEQGLRPCLLELIPTSPFKINALFSQQAGVLRPAISWVSGRWKPGPPDLRGLTKLVPTICFSVVYFGRGTESPPQKTRNHNICPPFLGAPFGSDPSDLRSDLRSEGGRPPAGPAAGSCRTSGSSARSPRWCCLAPEKNPPKLSLGGGPRRASFCVCVCVLTL